MPYGEEIIALGGRSSTDKYVADDVRQGFTGYVNDEETGLEFAQARMYANSLGRFTGADFISVTPARIAVPQQLNLYTYVANNPLVLVDPTGMTIEPTGLTDEQRKKWEQIVTLANAKDGKGNYVYKKLHEEYDRLQSDTRIFHIINTDKEGEGGRFTITNFKGENDFSEATIALNFKFLKNVQESQDAEMMVSGFKKYDGLFGKNGEILRLAETFGHEAGHAVFALDNTVDAVKDERLRAQNEIDRNALPKKHRYPLPPDLDQRMTLAQQFHNKTEL